MKIIISILLLVSLLSVRANDEAVKQNDAQYKDLSTAMVEIATIKVGSSKQELLRLFSEDGGGLSSPPKYERYVYRRCPCIKVDVGMDSDGKIVSLSKPYLEQPISD